MHANTIPTLGEMTQTHKKTHFNKVGIPSAKGLEDNNNSCLDKAGINNKDSQAVVNSNFTLVKWCHRSDMVFIFWSLYRQSTSLLIYIFIILCILLLSLVNSSILLLLFLSILLFSIFLAVSEITRFASFMLSNESSFVSQFFLLFCRFICLFVIPINRHLPLRLNPEKPLSCIVAVHLSFLWTT